MKNINWKYERKLFYLMIAIFLLFLTITLILVLINYQWWSISTGLLLSSTFSILNYWILILLTSFAVKITSNKLLLIILFVGRFFIYLLPIIAVTIFNNYFNIYSSLVGLIIPFIAILAFNFYYIIKEKRSRDKDE